MVEQTIKLVFDMYHVVFAQVSLSNEQHENDRINSSNCYSSINDTPAISDNCNVNSVLRRLRLNHPQQIIIGHLNINSIRNKFDLMKTMLTRHRHFNDYRDKNR